MTVKTRQIGPCLAAEVEGIDMRKPLSPEDVAAIHAGMDEYAVLVFHDQDIDDEQQLAFSRSLGQPDAYPFVLSAPAIEKLRFVHETIAAAAG